jgi:hypothetical protein
MGKREDVLREAQGRDVCDVAPSRSIQMSADRTENIFFFLFSGGTKEEIL